MFGIDVTKIVDEFKKGTDQLNGNFKKLFLEMGELKTAVTTLTKAIEKNNELLQKKDK